MLLGKKSKNFLYAIIQYLLYKTRLFRITNKLGIYKPRVLTLIDGGLGSQMWQFALGYAASEKAQLPLSLETDFYLYSGKDCNGKQNRQFLLFDLFPEIRKKYQQQVEGCGKYASFFRDRGKRSNYEFCPELAQYQKPIYLSQYYSNVKYIEGYKEELIRLFSMDITLSNEELKIMQKITACQSCAMHIRKGDFVGLSLDVCSDSYYIRAIERMIQEVPDVEFFIFSNDEDYFERNILPHCPTINYQILRGRSEETPQVDFLLMNCCKHSIISNSGFSWMAAFLKSSSSTVIMPDYWNNDPKRKESSKEAFFVPGWIKLNIK